MSPTGGALSRYGSKRAVLCSCSPWLRAPSSARSIELDLLPVASLFQRSKRFLPPEVALYGLFQAHPSVLLFRSHQSALTTYRPIPYCIQAFLLPLFRTYPLVEARQFSRENDPRLIPSCPAPNGQVQELLPRSLVAAKSGAPSPEHSRNYVIVTYLRDRTLECVPSVSRRGADLKILCSIPLTEYLPFRALTPCCRTALKS